MMTTATPSLIRPGLPAWLLIATACLASSMVVMDGAIVNVALPAMQQALHLSALAQQWVVDAYLLTLGGFMLLAARAGDLYGRRRTLLAGLALFTLSSLVGGMASSGSQLLIARALQGVGASVLATASMTLIVAATQHDKQARAKALSLWAAFNSAGFALGAVLGGILTARYGWQAVMFVNVPIGALLMLASLFCLQATPLQHSTLDWPGALTATLGSGCLIYGLSQSAQLGWSSLEVWGSLLAASLLLIGFVQIERRSPAPLLRLSLFQIPNQARGNLVMMSLGGTLAATVFLLSTQLQQLGHYPAEAAGLALLPFGVMLAVARLLFNQRAANGQARYFTLFGSLLASLALLWLATLPLRPDFWRHLLAPTLLLGFGLGMVVLTAMQNLTAGISQQDAGLVSGVANSARQLGGALGVAMAATLLRGGELRPEAMLNHYHQAYIAVALLCLLCGLLSVCRTSSRAVQAAG